MEAVHERDERTERIELTRAPTPVLIVFSILPVLVVLQILIVVVFNPVPFSLLALLLVAAGCCLAFCVLVIDQVLPVRLTLAEDGLHVGRTWGSETYAWHQIDAVKLVGATGCLGDDPTISSQKRFGIGLFLRIDGADKDRDTDDQPDVVLYTCVDQDASTLMRVNASINAYRSKLGSHRPTVKQFGGSRAKTDRLRQASA